MSELKFGNCNDPSLIKWFALLKAQLTESEQLRTVNDFFNETIAYKDDSVTWKETDYWATPIELMRKGAGDCEDYAIAKYMTLRLLGVPSSKMRITYVKALTQNIAHMVLVYEGKVLDNLVGDIRPVSQRTDLLPVYSFNAEGLYLPSVKGDLRTSDTKNLSRWQDVLQKMRCEGFDLGEG